MRPGKKTRLRRVEAEPGLAMRSAKKSPDLASPMALQRRHGRNDVHGARETMFSRCVPELAMSDWCAGLDWLCHACSSRRRRRSQIATKQLARGRSRLIGRFHSKCWRRNSRSQRYACCRRCQPSPCPGHVHSASASPRRLGRAMGVGESRKKAKAKKDVANVSMSARARRTGADLRCLPRRPAGLREFRGCSRWTPPSPCMKATCRDRAKQAGSSARIAG